MLKNRGGFTLFEVMITLAVSSAMLVITIGLFSGQQRQTQFSQSMRNLESVFQDVINDATTGYFPNSTLKCSSDASGPSIDVGVGEQGSNQGCIFLGKAMHIQTDHLDIYPVVGSSSLEATTFQSALPMIVPSLVESKQYLWGLTVYDILWDTTTSHIAEGSLIAVVTTPNGTGSTSGGSLNSGLQRVMAYSSGGSVVVSGTSSSDDLTSALRHAGLGWATGDRVTLCLRNDSGQKGGIIMSGGSEGVSARLTTDTDTVVCT